MSTLGHFLGVQIHDVNDDLTVFHDASHTKYVGWGLPAGECWARASVTTQIVLATDRSFVLEFDSLHR